MMDYEINYSFREDPRIALIDGSKVAFWERSGKMLTGDHLGEYLGEGVVYSIGGTIQHAKRRYHFWAKPTTTRVER